MGTANFSNKNASCIFAREIEDEFEYEMFEENVICDLKDAFPKMFYKKMEYDTNRNYGGKKLGYIELNKFYFKDNVITINIFPVIRSGYYSGVNLDYEYQFMFESCGYDVTFHDLSELDSVIDEIAEKNKNKLKKYISIWLENNIDKLVKKLEKIYSNNADKYKVVGRFSNGETLYEKIK